LGISTYYSTILTYYSNLEKIKINRELLVIFKKIHGFCREKRKVAQTRLFNIITGNYTRTVSLVEHAQFMMSTCLSYLYYNY